MFRDFLSLKFLWILSLFKGLMGSFSLKRIVIYNFLKRIVFIIINSMNSCLRIAVSDTSLKITAS
jgi:hypothetical protein